MDSDKKLSRRRLSVDCSCISSQAEKSDPDAKKSPRELMSGKLSMEEIKEPEAYLSVTCRLTEGQNCSPGGSGCHRANGRSSSPGVADGQLGHLFHDGGKCRGAGATAISSSSKGRSRSSEGKYGRRLSLAVNQLHTIDEPVYKQYDRGREDKHHGHRKSSLEDKKRDREDKEEQQQQRSRAGRDDTKKEKNGERRKKSLGGDLKNAPNHSVDHHVGNSVPGGAAAAVDNGAAVDGAAATVPATDDRQTDRRISGASGGHHEPTSSSPGGGDAPSEPSTSSTASTTASSTVSFVKRGSRLWRRVSMAGKWRDSHEDNNKRSSVYSGESCFQMLAKRRQSEGFALKEKLSEVSTSRRGSDPLDSSVYFLPQPTLNVGGNYSGMYESSTMQCFCGDNSCPFCNLLLNLKLTEPK